LNIKFITRSKSSLLVLLVMFLLANDSTLADTKRMAELGFQIDAEDAISLAGSTSKQILLSFSTDW
jgi:hypothetical protein